MNEIAPYLRSVASIALFAQCVDSKLDEFEASPDIIDTVKQGFRSLIARAEHGRLVIPEYNKSKSALSKFKKAEQYVDFAEKLFKGAL
jgi:hypothetical protein